MILSSDIRILMVPDFCVSATDEAMLTLKKSIERAGRYSVKVVDLPAIVSTEHGDEELTDAKLIELSARKLEQLAWCDELVWDGTNTIKQRKRRVIHLRFSDGKLSKFPEQEVTPEQQLESLPEDTDEAFDIDRTNVRENKDETIDPDIIDEFYSRAFSNDEDSYNWGVPHIVAVFGKSAMLAGGLGQKDVLFINPKYDSDWPWKKQYYADKKLTEEYHCDKYEYERGFMETVLWEGTELTRPWRYSCRYGLITSADHISEFWDRYPRMAEVNIKFENDTEAQAKFICDFADNKLTFPLEEVYEAIRNLPGRDISNLNKICDFIEPVKLNDITVTGIRFGAPMSNGQSCYKL